MVSFNNSLGLRWWGLYDIRDHANRRVGRIRISSDRGLCRGSAEEVGHVSDLGDCMMACFSKTERTGFGEDAKVSLVHVN